MQGLVWGGVLYTSLLLFLTVFFQRQKSSRRGLFFGRKTSGRAKSLVVWLLVALGGKAELSSCHRLFELVTCKKGWWTQVIGNQRHKAEDFFQLMEVFFLWKCSSPSQGHYKSAGSVKIAWSFSLSLSSNMFFYFITLRMELCN